jgi:hypothetical protein
MVVLEFASPRNPHVKHLVCVISWREVIIALDHSMYKREIAMISQLCSDIVGEEYFDSLFDTSPGSLGTISRLRPDDSGFELVAHLSANSHVRYIEVRTEAVKVYNTPFYVYSSIGPSLMLVQVRTNEWPLEHLL